MVGWRYLALTVNQHSQSSSIHMHEAKCKPWYHASTCGDSCTALFHLRSPSPDLLSEDMRRERARVEWERAAMMEQDREETEDEHKMGPVHYQDLQQGGTEDYVVWIDACCACQTGQ